MDTLSFEMIRQYLATAVLCAFLVCAVWEIHSKPRRCLRYRSFVLVYCASLVVLLVVGCSMLFLVSPAPAALTLANSLLWKELPLIAIAGAFLLGALCMRRAPLPRPLSLLDRRLLRGRAPRPRFSRRIALMRLLEMLLYAAAMLLFSSLWLHLAVTTVGARISSKQIQAFQPSGTETHTALNVSILVLVVMAPFIEEVIFRGFIQQKIAQVLSVRRPRKTRLALSLAVLLTSALWALYHAELIAPVWVKWVQIFGIGLILGCARIRLGLEACIVLHLVFNLLGGFYAPKIFLPENQITHQQKVEERLSPFPPLARDSGAAQY